MFRFVFASAALLGAAPAFGHVSFSPDALLAGQPAQTALIVPHGCAGQPTDTIRIDIPAEVAAQATAPDGWTVERTETGLMWSGGSLGHEDRGVFPVTLTLPASDVGTAFAFPTTQICGAAQEVWAEGGDGPTPTITVADPAMTVGALHIGDVFARATLPGAPVGGGYLTIRNDGDSDDVLVSASLDLAGRSSLHSMEMTGDTMRMAPLPDGLTVPAGGEATLEPSGNHIMFERLTGPLVEGETLPLTLTFRDAGTITVPMTVRAINAGAGSHHH